MYRIMSNNQVVAICDRFRWVRMMDGVLVGTIKATAQGFEARVPVAEGESYQFQKQVYALEEGGLTGTAPWNSTMEATGRLTCRTRTPPSPHWQGGGVVDKQEAKGHPGPYSGTYYLVGSSSSSKVSPSDLIVSGKAYSTIFG